MAYLMNFLTSDIPDWKRPFSIRRGLNLDNVNLLKLHAATGRPLGDDKFIEAIEDETGRELKKRKPGPKKNN